jgi:protein gp37
MSAGTGIQWTDQTWNPVTGCDRVSPGCAHCYALDLAARLKAMGNPRYRVDGDPKTSGPGFGVMYHADKLKEPLGWKKPRRVFVNSMSDLFHEEIPWQFVAAVFATMIVAHQHTFQVLTKRAKRMRDMLDPGNGYFWSHVNGLALKLCAEQKIYGVPVGVAPGNVWLGVSVENQHWADVRIPLLLETPAAIRFLSCEPLLGPVDLCSHLRTGGLHWVIAGGESGPKHRPMHAEWPRQLLAECTPHDVPFFFKQWGGRTPKAGGRELDGRIWDEFPRAQP